MGTITQRHNVEQHVTPQSKLLNIRAFQPVKFPVPAVIIHRGHRIIKPIHNQYNFPTKSSNSLRINII